MPQVYARFADKRIWMLEQQAQFSTAETSWGSWVEIGGMVTGAPAVAVSLARRSTDVLARQADTRLYVKEHLSRNGSDEYWQLLPGAFAAGPAAIAKSSGLLEIVVQGVDLQLYHTTQLDSSQKRLAFDEFQPLGGRTASFAC